MSKIDKAICGSNTSCQNLVELMNKDSNTDDTFAKQQADICIADTSKCQELIDGYKAKSSGTQAPQSPAQQPAASVAQQQTLQSPVLQPKAETPKDKKKRELAEAKAKKAEEKKLAQEKIAFIKDLKDSGFNATEALEAWNAELAKRTSAAQQPAAPQQPKLPQTAEEAMGLVDSLIDPAELNKCLSIPRSDIDTCNLEVKQDALFKILDGRGKMVGNCIQTLYKSRKDSAILPECQARYKQVIEDLKTKENLTCMANGKDEDVCKKEIDDLFNEKSIKFKSGVRGCKKEANEVYDQGKQASEAEKSKCLKEAKKDADKKTCSEEHDERLAELKEAKKDAADKCLTDGEKTYKPSGLMSKAKAMETCTKDPAICDAEYEAAEQKALDEKLAKENTYARPDKMFFRGTLAPWTSGVKESYATSEGLDRAEIGLELNPMWSVYDQMLYLGFNLGYQYSWAKGSDLSAKGIENSGIHNFLVGPSVLFSIPVADGIRLGARSGLDIQVPMSSGTNHAGDGGIPIDNKATVDGMFNYRIPMMAHAQFGWFTLEAGAYYLSEDYLRTSGPARWSYANSRIVPQFTVGVDLVDAARRLNIWNYFFSK